MKHIICALSSFVLAVCLCSCADSTRSLPQEILGTEDISLENVNTSASVDSSPQNKTISFEPNKNLKIVATFIYDNDTYIVVENTGTQAILNYKVAYINYDKNGFITTNDSAGYERGKADTVNLMPGGKDIAAWYGSDGSYIDAAVVGIDFADGTTWEVTEAQIDIWANESKKTFSLDNQKAVVDVLKETGTLAENNNYVSLANYTIKHGNQFSSNHDFHFSIDNTSNQGITRLNIFVLEYDKNGFPVSVSPWDTYCINGHQTGGTVNLAVGQSGSYSDTLFLSPTTTQIKAIISRIEFQDGTDWTNPYLYEWIIGNSGSY